jgi:uncharacterized OB-fold protein
VSERPLPLADADTEFFWEGARALKLMILRCADCGTYVHYPKPGCWNCGGANLAPEQVSGRGTVYSYTVTHRDVPGLDAPFAVVIVELEEQRGLRMVSRMIDMPPEDVRIGLPVEVVFQPVAEDVFLPLFRWRKT